MYKITLRFDKQNWKYLVSSLKKIFFSINSNFLEDEAELIIFTEDLSEKSLKILDKVLDDYEKRFSYDVFLEIKDLDFGEPSVKSEEFKVGSVNIKYLSKLNFDLDAFGSHFNTIVLRTDYGFGNGQHPTTYLCIEMMQKLLNTHKLETALDFGCGTGILAIIASKIFDVKVYGVDIDPLCIKMALKNAELNKVKNKVNFKQGSWEAVKGSFDLILANLTPSLLIESYDKIYNHLSSSGFAIISGLLRSHFKDLEYRLNQISFKILELKERYGWIGAVLKK